METNAFVWLSILLVFPGLLSSSPHPVHLRSGGRRHVNGQNAPSKCYIQMRKVCFNLNSVRHIQTVGFKPAKDATVSPVSLSFERFEPDLTDRKNELPLVIVHGLFGSKRNWRSIVIVNYTNGLTKRQAKAFNKRHGMTVYALDMRNHGESIHASPMNYDAMALDLDHFFKKHNLDRLNLVGHSMYA